MKSFDWSEIACGPAGNGFCIERKTVPFYTKDCSRVANFIFRRLTSNASDRTKVAKKVSANNPCFNKKLYLCEK